MLFEEDNSIPEVDSFVKEQGQRFNFTPIIMGKDVKKETFKLVDDYHMKAIFLGNRRVDPYSCTLLLILKFLPFYFQQILKSILHQIQIKDGQLL